MSRLIASAVATAQLLAFITLRILPYLGKKKKVLAGLCAVEYRNTGHDDHQLYGK
jgi:hypothetical protein